MLLDLTHLTLHVETIAEFVRILFTMDHYTFGNHHFAQNNPGEFNSIRNNLENKFIDLLNIILNSNDAFKFYTSIINWTRFEKTLIHI